MPCKTWAKSANCWGHCWESRRPDKPTLSSEKCRASCRAVGRGASRNSPTAALTTQLSEFAKSAKSRNSSATEAATTSSAAPSEPALGSFRSTQATPANLANLASWASRTLTKSRGPVDKRVPRSGFTTGAEGMEVLKFDYPDAPPSQLGNTGRGGFNGATVTQTLSGTK